MNPDLATDQDDETPLKQTAGYRKELERPESREAATGQQEEQKAASEYLYLREGDILKYRVEMIVTKTMS